jgi:uncharacterized membrane protein YhaH (DUF805 family)
MNFRQAVAAGFANCVNFSGRATRSEYWYFALFWVIGQFVFQVVDFEIGLRLTRGLFALIMFLPSLAVSIRRLHDLDRSGWWMFLMLVPVLGFIVFLIWWTERGTVGPNRFGPDPLAAGGDLDPLPVV